ncbi:MAG: hypothetical protein ACYS7Y_16010 [Planctomycetota bacterium]|jgi:hypothetical protein
MSYLKPEKANLIYGSIGEEQVSNNAGFIVEQLEEYEDKFKQCSCTKCTESAQWAQATAICLLAGRLLETQVTTHRTGKVFVRAKRGLLYLASLGATNELVSRVEEARKHNNMVLPHKPKI